MKRPNAPEADPPFAVTPIAWNRFRSAAPGDADSRAGLRLLQNSARYSLAWIPKTFARDPARQMFVVTEMNENGIRPPSSAAFGIAVLLQTGGAWDNAAAGLDETGARTRVVELIKGIADVHKANAADPRRGWGDHWQSALWAALAGQAAWMLWDFLDAETKTLAARMVVHEADRFIAPGYAVPYWYGPTDTLNFPGDTKAEENAWNSMIVSLAPAMLPSHPHAPEWRRVCSELMVSAFSQKRDRDSNRRVLDGKPVREWLNGYNVRDDGAVINHNLLHPDYTATPTLNLRAFSVQSLAHQPVPETADFNADLLYRTLTTQNFPSPPFKPPGGALYQPGKVELYYPQGTDWSRLRFDIYYLYDVFADAFGWDKGAPYSARGWLRLRSARMAQMQARFPDGRLYAPGEFDTYAGREQLALWQLADAYLFQWLRSQRKLSRKSNWL